MESMIESTPVADIYADGIGAVEILGDNVRIIFYTQENGEKIISCKLVRPIKSVRGELVKLLAEAMAGEALELH